MRDAVECVRAETTWNATDTIEPYDPTPKPDTRSEIEELRQEVSELRDELRSLKRSLAAAVK
jgi:hypothetical protein